MSPVEEIINRRRDFDIEEYDSFLEFVTVESLGELRIVHRETRPQLEGVVNAHDDILLPVAFDEIRTCLGGKFLRIRVQDAATSRDYYGIWSLENKGWVVDVSYDDIQSIQLTDYIWCRKGKEWLFCDMQNGDIKRVPNVSTLLSSSHFRCALKSNERTGFYQLVCVDDDGLESKSQLRYLALEQKEENAGRISLYDYDLNLIVISDVYGHVLYTNFNKE